MVAGRRAKKQTRAIAEALGIRYTQALRILNTVKVNAPPEATETDILTACRAIVERERWWNGEAS
jgi:hypothetical protein